MLVSFCLRLAWGLIACTLFLHRMGRSISGTSLAPPRFFRVQYLTTLGLLAVAAFFLRDAADVWCWMALGVSALLAFVGSVVWHVEDAPGGRMLGWLTAAAVTAALLLGGEAVNGDRAAGPRIADDFSAAAVLGAATTAMLMGHSYLIAPAMSLTPLYRLIGALGVALIVRTVLAGYGLWLWTRSGTGGNLEGEMLLWLPARWLLGLIGPLVLGWMAWETARIRSTQSATGILYVVTIVCFLGELTSQLLFSRTGFVL